MKLFARICLTAALVVSPFAILEAQSARTLVSRGDQARQEYDFASAIQHYQSALARSEDEQERVSISEKITQCENGQSMLEYSSRPEVISTITVPRSDFFLYYSHFADRAWKKGENGQAILFDSGDNTLVMPMRGEDGHFDLYSASRQGDGGWSPLENLGPNVNSAGDEVFATLADGGKRLYFSSNGLSGMGGYDIFVSEWDNASGTWSAPENLGFPFSSPADDMLFCNTPDGNYSLFASNRKCAADSMTVYLLKFDNTPIKKAVSSPEEARRVAALRPRANLLDKAIEDTHLEANMEDETFKKYYSSVSRYSTVKDSIKTLKNELSDSRKLYSSSSESDRPVIARSIKNTEDQLLSLQTRLGDIASEMQVLEMDFLVKGTSINPEELEEEIVNSSRKETSEVKVAAGYSFEKRVMGKMPVLEFAQPELAVDLNFRIDSEGTEIISDFKLPEYLVYQIQLTSTGTPAPASKFKGINPVFETKASASKYIYRAGLFSTYAEANKKVATCKSKGFSGAFIVAYDNGGAINVKTARQLEEKRKTSVKYKVVFTNCPDGIPAEVRKVISDQCSKDIARGSRDGSTIYFIAPFDSESDADRLAQAARAAGAEGVIVEQIK